MPIIVRPAVSNEQVATYGHTDRDGGVRRRLHLLRRRHRLDPRDVGPTRDQRLDLLTERLERVGLGEIAERFEQRSPSARPTPPRRRGAPPPRPPRRRARRPAGRARGPGPRAPCSVEAVPVAAERVGEDDVGAGVDEPPVQVLHPVGVVDVPELGRLTGVEAHREVVRAGGAVGEQHTLGGEELGEFDAHAGTVAPRPGTTAALRPPRSAGRYVPTASEEDPPDG